MIQLVLLESYTVPDYESREGGRELTQFQTLSMTPSPTTRSV